MSNIQRLCEKISNKMGDELQLEKDQKAVVQYGLFAMIHTSLSLILNILFGLMFGVLIPALIISIIAVILRKYSGGVHADNPEECAIIGIVVSVGGSLVLTRLTWQPMIVVGLGVMIFGWAFYLVYRLAPVDSKSKPIKKVEKRHMLKKKSYFVLGVDLVIVIIMLGFYFFNTNDQLLLYITCIYGGISWQVFTLTSWGHGAIAQMDTLFNKLVKK